MKKHLRKNKRNNANCFGNNDNCVINTCRNSNKYGIGKQWNFKESGRCKKRK